MHDPRHGFAWGGRGRDFDGDGKMMELDDDAGGCLDGWEDANKNGKFEQGPDESDNFEKSDDACISGSQVSVQDIVLVSLDSLTSKLDSRYSVQFSFREVDGAQKGRATVTSSYRSQTISNNPGCLSNHIETSEPYQYVVDVQVQVMKGPDGTVVVSVHSPVGFKPPMLRIVSTCPEIPPMESEVVTVEVSGVLRNGVYDERIDYPLTDGTTGTWYLENHIRQVGGR